MKKNDLTQKQDVVPRVINCRYCTTSIDIECDTKVYLALHYMKSVYNIVWNIFRLHNSSYSTDEIAGIRNEVFCKLFDKQCALLKQFNGEKGSFNNYLKVIANSTVLDYLRYRNRRSMESLGFDQPVDYLWQYLEDKEEKRLLGTGIKKLKSKKIQAVMNLVNKNHLDKEIANKLNIKIDTVRIRKFRGIRDLQSLIPKL